MRPLRAPLALTLAPIACLSHDPLRSPARPLSLVAVRSPRGALDELSRFADLTLVFDRPVAFPDPDAVMLVALSPSDALLADAAHGALSAANAARRVPCTVRQDARDPAVLRMRADAALQPDLRMTLLLTGAVYAADDGPIALPDAGPRVLSTAVRVAPAARCGPVPAWNVIDDDAVPTRTRTLWARFDRAVHTVTPGAPIARIVGDDGREVSSRASLGCADPAGGFRCAQVSPTRALTADTRYALHVENLAARNGRVVEDPSHNVTVRSLGAWTRSAFAPSPVCASDEVQRADFCVRAVAQGIELRALTTRRAALFARGSDGRGTREALGEVGTSHRLRVPVVSDGSTHAITVWALGLDGTPDASEVVWPVVSARAAPRVRFDEVLAHPAGAAAQEFVELVSDEPAAVSLAGWSVVQGTSRAVFPSSARVSARGRAVVVASVYDPRGTGRGVDPAVASGASLVVVPSSIARGLRDSGADLALLDPAGVIRSVFPGASPELAARQGVALVRADTDLGEDDSAAWTYDANGSSTPGAPDALR